MDYVKAAVCLVIVHRVIIPNAPRVVYMSNEQTVSGCAEVPTAPLAVLNDEELVVIAF